MEPGLLGQAPNMRKFPIFKNKWSHLTFPAIRANASLAVWWKSWTRQRRFLWGKDKAKKIVQSNAPAKHQLASQRAAFHGVIISFEMEGTIKRHLVQLLCSVQGYLQLNQVLTVPSSQHISGQLVPVHPSVNISKQNSMAFSILCLCSTFFFLIRK